MTRMMRSALIAAALVSVGGNPARAWSDFFPDSSRRYIIPLELDELDCYGLWHARNEIYAREGFRFKTPESQAEFGDRGWTDHPKLNTYEARNVELIKQAEQLAYCKPNSLNH